MFVLSLTVTTALAELFAGIGSPTGEVTFTRLVNLPSRIARVVIVAVIADALFIVPRLKVTTPLAKANDPCEVVAETNDNGPGRGSLSTTEVAVEGPLLVTTIVKVVLLDASSVVGEALWETERSDEAITVTLALAELLPRFGSVKEFVTVPVLL